MFSFFVFIDKLTLDHSFQHLYDSVWAHSKCRLRVPWGSRSPPWSCRPANEGNSVVWMVCSPERGSTSQLPEAPHQDL